MGNSRLHELDFLRGIALLGVIIVHTVQSFSTGYTILDNILGLGSHGVQLFFAISGFTMMMIFHKKERITVLDIKQFYLKRFMRIVPFFFIAGVLYSYKYIDSSSFNQGSSFF